ncbi:MAG: NfeD family protein [Mariniblastus sp.]|nr:NfeD family protein [Mariniblastus sp.]MDG2182002.1 NfeD family protein [Mariniblastus sp.]
MIYWAFLLLAIGLFAVILELFVPSAGILGIVAGILIVTSVVLGFMESVSYGVIVLTAAVVTIPGLLALMVKVWPYTPLGKRILLKDLKPEDVLPNYIENKEQKERLEGQLGIAQTKMLPSGIVMVDGEKFDAVSEGFAVEKGDAIRVISVRGNHVYVEPYHGEGEVQEELPPRDLDILSQPIEELGIDPLDNPLE